MRNSVMLLGILLALASGCKNREFNKSANAFGWGENPNSVSVKCVGYSREPQHKWESFSGEFRKIPDGSWSFTGSGEQRFPGGASFVNNKYVPPVEVRVRISIQGGFKKIEHKSNRRSGESVLHVEDFDGVIQFDGIYKEKTIAVKKKMGFFGLKTPVKGDWWSSIPPENGTLFFWPLLTEKAPNTENELGFALGEISPAILPGHSMMHLGNCNFTNVELLTL